MNYSKKYTLLYFTLLLSITIFGQGFPDIDAGIDQTLDCTTGNCADLSATFLETGETDSYAVSSIPFTPPYAFDVGTEAVDIDDRFSSVINIGFNFCFFGNTYNQLVAGSNGEINFDTSLADSGSGYVINNGDMLPTTTSSIKDNAIFGALHDIDISIADGPNNTERLIAYEVFGVAPFRTFVANYNKVAHFGGSCHNNETTQQIVLYETTNIIEVYLKEKPTCTSWNGGNAILGIQNIGATQAYFPPGRNGGSWSTTDEAWRFTPDGTPNYQFTWYDEGGSNIGNTPNLSVCPTTDATYTAEVIYSNCDGNTVTLTDDMFITVNTSYDVSTDPDQDFCQGDPPFTIQSVVSNLDADVTITDYIWYETSDLSTPLAQGVTATSLTVSTSGTYEVHVIGSDGCDVISQTIVTYHPIPTVIAITDYELCDDATADGLTIFDLTTKDSEILNAQTGVAATYYTTPADAVAMTNEITPATNFTNTVANQQTIYVNLENTAAGCSTTTEFEIIVNPNPIANQPSNMEQCDDDTDGFMPFDLSTQTATLIGTQTGVSVSYHISPADADSGNNPHPLTYTNVVSPVETVYVRIETTATGCFATTTFDITVNPLPLVNIANPIIECDDDLDGDDTNTSSLFDLNAIQDTTILGGQTGMTITYHESQNDADNGTNSIVMPYANTSSPQTIYVRVENDLTLCYITSTFDITINPLPTVTQPNDLSICDNSDDGDDTNGFVQTFGLDAQTIIIEGVQVGTVTTTYYENQVDADNDTNPIDALLPYENITANDQTIYFRIEDNTTGCYRTDTFDIHVTAVPTIVNPGTQTVCDDYDISTNLDPTDGFVNNWDFTPLDTGIINGQILTVNYHEILADAEAGANVILFPYTNITAFTQPIYIRVEDSSGCFTTDTFDIQIDPLPTILTDGDTDGDPFNDFIVTELSSCDDATADGITSFILADKEIELLNGETGVIVTYHTLQVDA